MSGQGLISSDAYKCWLHVIHIKSWCHYKELYGCNVWTLRYALTHTVHYMTRCWYVIASPDTYHYESNPSLFLLLLYPSSSSSPSPFPPPSPSPLPLFSMQYLRNLKTPVPGPSSQRSLPPSPMSSLAMGVATSSPETTLLSRWVGSFHTQGMSVKVGGFIPHTGHVCQGWWVHSTHKACLYCSTSNVHR